MPVTEIDQILTLTDEVERCLDDGDWLSASKLNAQRQALLTEFFAGQPIDNLDAGTRNALSEILNRNQAAVKRVQTERRELAGVSRRLSGSANAVSAYQRNSATSEL